MRNLCLLLCALACIMGLMLFEQERAEPMDEAEESQLRQAANVQASDIVYVEVSFPKEPDEDTAAPAETALPVTMLNVYDEGRTERVALEEYLIHVVAGEMPASYEPEALRAQAVAARSYVAWKMPAYGGSGCSKGVNTDVCTDSTHCMAYLSTERMHEKWGDDYELYYEKIADAVRDTAREVMLYSGNPIQALFHSSSGGKTEDAQAVWGTAYPYLQSVDSDGEETSGQYTAVKRLKTAELVDKLNKAFDGAGLTVQNVDTLFCVRSVTDSGRADVVKVGKVTATGRAVRTALELNSTNFSIAYEGDEAVITTIGYGHGVGMSQVGANAMAQQGSTYREILEHYYTGISIGTLGA